VRCETHVKDRLSPEVSDAFEESATGLLLLREGGKVNGRRMYQEPAAGSGEPAVTDVHEVQP
jgi:hypothetical protein